MSISRPAKAGTPLSRPHTEREIWSEELLDRLTPVMSALGVLFLLVVLAERTARPGSILALVLAVAGWLLWAAFVLEFVARTIVAPDTGRFLRRNWWQVLFLLLPFLRFLRLLRAVRLLRSGRLLSSAIRSSRSTGRVLGDRVAWLAAVSAIVVLATSQVLYEFGDYERYGDALYATATAAVAGEPLEQESGFARVLSILLLIYSAGVFATLAGTFGAYFVESRTPAAAPSSPAGPTADPPVTPPRS